MLLPFLLLIHGILAVSLSHSHLPFLHEFIHRIVLIVLFQFPHPHQRLRVVSVQQTGSKRFVSSVTALHCTARATIVLVSQSLYVAEDPEFRTFVKIEVAIRSSPSLIVHTVTVDVKQH